MHKALPPGDRDALGTALRMTPRARRQGRPFRVGTVPFPAVSSPTGAEMGAEADLGADTSLLGLSALPAAPPAAPDTEGASPYLRAREPRASSPIRVAEGGHSAAVSPPAPTSPPPAPALSPVAAVGAPRSGVSPKWEGGGVLARPDRGLFDPPGGTSRALRALDESMDSVASEEYFSVERQTEARMRALLEAVGFGFVGCVAGTVAAVPVAHLGCPRFEKLLRQHSFAPSPSARQAESEFHRLRLRDQGDQEQLRDRQRADSAARYMVFPSPWAPQSLCCVPQGIHVVHSTRVSVSRHHRQREGEEALAARRQEYVGRMEAERAILETSRSLQESSRRRQQETESKLQAVEVPAGP